ncbi:discoidin domain-containing protein [Myxococcaceae bacterium GXIMD 01537]
MLAACESQPRGDEPTEQAVPTPEAPASTPSELTAPNCRIVTTARVTAIGDDGNPATNTQDDDALTRWSYLGKGAWLTMDLGTVQPIAGTTIAWHRGNERQNHFTVETSEDGSTFSPAYAGDSALDTTAQTVNFPSTRNARYVRVTVNGNTVNDWNSIAEARACAGDSAPGGGGGTTAPEDTSCSPLASAKATAIGDDGNPASNTQDGDPATRWSYFGKGAWLRMDLGATKTVTGASVAWHRGNERQNHFTVESSVDGVTFTQGFAADSALTSEARTYRFPSSRTARYVRVTVNGNTVNDWNSISEARACGEGTTTPPTTPPPSSTDSGPALARAPYLQSVGPTSALVAFRTAVSCTPFVRFGQGTDVSRSASATVAGWRHAVKLDGLSPGQTYSYVVEACGSRTGVRSFRTATLPGTSRVHFTALGDFGTGGTQQANVIKELLKPERRGELLITLGDNAYESGTDAEFQDRMFKPMAALLREVPLFTSPGNHEYVTNQGQPYLDNVYMPTNNPAGSERYYSFDWGPVHFVSIDSNCAIGLASADRCTLAAQKSWVSADLAATRQPWKVVFFHHPPWSSGEHGSQLQMRRQFAPLFEQYNVDLVLTGHDHEYERSKPMKGDAVAPSGTRGIPYLVVGSGGATLRSWPSSQPAWTAYRDNKNYGHLDVVVDGGTLTAKFLSPGGIVRDSLTLTKTLPAASAASALSTPPAELRTAPGPVDDPNVAPPGLISPQALPPAESLEATADHNEPVNQ